MLAAFVAAREDDLARWAEVSGAPATTWDLSPTSVGEPAAARSGSVVRTSGGSPAHSGPRCRRVLETVKIGKRLESMRPAIANWVDLELPEGFADDYTGQSPVAPATAHARPLPGRRGGHPGGRTVTHRVDPVVRRQIGRGRSIGPRLPGGTIRSVTRRSTAPQQLQTLARLRRVRDRIDREYAQPLDVEGLARGVHLSAGHLSRQFRLAYGESPYFYLMTRRIERAMALLRRGDLTVTEVCFAVGCSSLGTFSTRFAELVGVAPGAYRRQAASAVSGLPSCVAKQVTRPVRNREAPVRELSLA